MFSAELVPKTTREILNLPSRTWWKFFYLCWRLRTFTATLPDLTLFPCQLWIILVPYSTLLRSFGSSNLHRQAQKRNCCYCCCVARLNKKEWNKNKTWIMMILKFGTKIREPHCWREWMAISNEIGCVLEHSWRIIRRNKGK